MLALGIILLIISIKISIRIKDITDNIDDATGSLSTLLTNLNKLASPAVACRVVVHYIRNYINKKKGKTKNEQTGTFSR